MNAASQSRRGFTLLEMMVVIGIMGILMAVASLDYVKTAPKRRLHGAAFDVMTTFRQARMMAASYNAPVEVSINGSTITIWADKDMDDQRDAGEETQKDIDSTISLMKYPDRGRFNSRGMFTSDGFYMYIYMYSNGTAGETVYVFPSGHVDLYYY